jgi:UDP-3-O-[3-hydroxymyristoyl] glucosamine N-acyltransferase
MKSPRTRQATAVSDRILGDVRIGKNVTIHDTSIIGFPNDYQSIFTNKAQRVVRIGTRSIIYPWSLIYEGATIGDKVEVHERCTVGSLTTIGANSMVQYGAQVHDNVRIGKNCIIAGFIADNTVVGEGSSVFGALIHRYKHPGRRSWDDTDELGPTLGKNVIIAWGAVIVGDIKIGNGAWILPNSVVRKDVPAGARYDGK